ncbi:MAG: DUF3253 domain-containing protein [Verrucomicrobiae bacterium]|nr:DUF3253 domain-containing protein [Verrucomicrobiae bacterium]
MDQALNERISHEIRRLTTERGVKKSICPSEVARALADGEGDESWRNWMEAVRKTAAILVDHGEIVVTQKGKPIDPESAKGPIRLAVAPGKEVERT